MQHFFNITSASGASLPSLIIVDYSRFDYLLSRRVYIDRSTLKTHCFIRLCTTVKTRFLSLLSKLLICCFIINNIFIIIHYATAHSWQRRIITLETHEIMYDV